MSSDVYKLLILIRRKPGLSVQQFRQYYEERHSKLGEESSPKVGMIYYCRRYLEPISNDEPEYDVLTECWFDDFDKFTNVVARLRSEALSSDVYDDEARFMDRSKTRFFTVVEHVSVL
jgi:EthD domain